MLLFLTDRKQIGLTLTRGLTAEGIPVLQTGLETGMYLCRERPTSAVLIDGIPNAEEAVSLCLRLRGECHDLPIALILPEHCVADTVADRVIRRSGPEELMAEVRRFCETCGWQPRLSTFTLFLDENPADSALLGYRLPLSPREHQILRFLFFRAPELVSRKELLSVCFPEGSQKAENLTVQINHINRKARMIGGISLIKGVYGKGYKLCDGIV